jgi:hypothetical protein
MISRTARQFGLTWTLNCGWADVFGICLALYYVPVGRSLTLFLDLGPWVIIGQVSR